MADITYTRTFQHVDWIDNEDVVQAGGEKGFNQKFHDLEAEFDKVSGVVNNVNTAIKQIQIQQLDFVMENARVRIDSNDFAEFDVETYDRTGMPPKVEKVYFATIFPSADSGPITNLQHHFRYQTAPGNKISVTVIFVNPISSSTAFFGFRVMALAPQT
jgi:hypothetical protein